MKQIVLSFTLFLLLVTFISCCAPIKDELSKSHPEYSNIITDSDVKSIKKSFLEEASRQGIKFTNDVTIGFKKFNTKDPGQRNIIGLCVYGDGWREIDLNIVYWKNTNFVVKEALLFHELSHAFCDRDHDYGKDRFYPSPRPSILEKIMNIMIQKVVLSPIKPDGYFEDGCPISLMHPVIPSEKCIIDHRDHYKIEIFDRCIPF